jgi:RNA polymerase sigma factor for flagellar operon FliA
MERERLILDHLQICKAVALRIQRMLPVQFELDDLIHEGVFGLIDAANKYDLNRQVEFSSYARHRIRGAILDSIRELDFASRGLRDRCKKMNAITGKLGNELLRDPTEDEIAERLEISVANLRKLRFDAQSLTHMSTNRINPGDNTEVELEFPNREETQPDYMLSRVEMHAALDKAMKPLPPRQQQVIRAYYSGAKTIKEIGDWLRVTECRVHQLHQSALARMQTQLRASGVHSGRAF